MGANINGLLAISVLIFADLLEICVFIQLLMGFGVVGNRQWAIDFVKLLVDLKIRLL